MERLDEREDRTELPAVPVGFSRPDVAHARLAARVDDKPVNILLRKDALLGAGITTHTCPQCGLNPAGTPKKRMFQWVPPWVYLGLLMNILVLLLLMVIGRKRVKTHVTLCDDCDKADRRGRNLRVASVLGAVLAPFLGLIGLIADNVPVGASLGGVGLVAGIVGSVVVHRRTRGDVILCTHIDKERVTLKVVPAWRRVLVKERPDLLAG